jgi:hypothetical protein
MAKLLIALALLVAMIVLSPILSILAINWLLGTAIAITVQTWVLFWGAMLLAAIPLVILQILILRIR